MFGESGESDAACRHPRSPRKSHDEEVQILRYGREGSMTRH